MEVVVNRVKGGGALLAVEGEGGAGELLAEIVEYVEGVKIVSAVDLHRNNADVLAAFKLLERMESFHE